MTTNPIFQRSETCWRVDFARHATPLVDCANYYAAVHAAICNARKSIFIVGWEIDSGLHLLRGPAESATKYPSALIDLLSWKAQSDAIMQIYLLRWDSSLAFVTEREFMAGYTWTANTPENVHVCLDASAPIAGSHHQKIILIDDELAFCGGMDIARQRWDTRQHLEINELRNDANGPYGPYHDVQIMVDGPIVRSFGELVRERWFRAADYEARPFSPPSNQLATTAPEDLQSPIAASWPSAFPPQVFNVECAIARTIPASDTGDGIHEVSQMYLNLIRQAKHFIYIENQFLTVDMIAKTLNIQLRDQPNLRVLIASSHNPQGIFEREGMWAGRIDFKGELEEGVASERVKMVCSGLKSEFGDITYKRIHSKVFVVDSSYVTIASSNLNNRSMVLDTECDITLAANGDAKIEAWMANFRNDLIAEHSGLSIENIDQLIRNRESLDNFFVNDSTKNHKGYQFFEIDDTLFTNKSLQALAQPLADPNAVAIVKNPSRQTLIGSTLLALTAVAGLLILRYQSDWFTTEKIRTFMEMAQASPFALPMVCLIYLVSGFVFFPVTLLSLITAAVFGALMGPALAMCGSLLSAAIMFWLGHFAGLKGLRSLFGSRVRAIDQYFERAGIIGVAIIRLIPIAPFTLVNLAAGISSVRFFSFIIGTFLGFLPGLFAKGIVADSLMQMFLNPSAKVSFQLTIGIFLWLVFAANSYFLARAWKRRKARNEA